jgi:intracellular sulfur oxidation DsrE/DsrF family protein
VPISALVSILRAVLVVSLLLAPLAHAGFAPGIVVDVPVRLKRARVVFNMDRIDVSGDRPTVFVWLDEMLLHFEQWHTRRKLIGIMHGPAGTWALNDAAYDRIVGTTGGNPYAADLASLQTRNVRFEICAYTMELNGWTNADLLPGVAVTTGAIARLIQLNQQGWTHLQP